MIDWSEVHASSSRNRGGISVEEAAAGEYDKVILRTATQ